MNPKAKADAAARFVSIPGIAMPLRADFLACIALALVAACIYLPMLGADFVYDARTIVLGNDYIHHLRNIADVLTLRIMHMDVMDNNRPVYVGNAMLDWAVWGANPAGHHLASLILHAVVTVLLFVFCRRVAGGASPWPAFCAALLFTVHPLNCEAVAEVSYRKDLLAAAFVLAALNFAISFQSVLSRRNVFLGAACVASLFLAVGSKENGVAGPPVLICYWLFFRRNESRAGWIALCVASALVVAAFLAARFLLPPADSAIFLHKPLPLGGSFAQAMFIQPRITACYFRQIVWPRNLCADYGLYSIRNFDAMFSLMAVFAVIGVQVFLATQSRLFALGAAVFWLALLPVCNLVPIYRPMADRFLYLPMAGVGIMLAAIPWRANGWGGAGVAFALVAAFALGRATVVRERAWQDSLALWSNAALRNPFSADVQNNLGSALFEAGRMRESVAFLEWAIQIRKGTSANDFASMALPLDAMGRRAEADAAFRKAVKLDQHFAHPDSLLQALIWEEKDVAALKVIADRNADAAQ